eukprot:2906576-Amphidinium_carterae.1
MLFPPLAARFIQAAIQTSSPAANNAQAALAIGAAASSTALSTSRAIVDQPSVKPAVERTICQILRSESS